ncbi:MAG: hypothetical protein WCT45_01075 [Candidatus Paceibacterota bacterium]|jgi:hypothetical protein
MNLEQNPLAAFKKFGEAVAHFYIPATIIIYSSGFLMWNYYLSSFSFFEWNLIQSRYISAGLLIWLPISLAAGVYVITLSRISDEKVKLTISSIFGVLVGVWFALISIFFQNIPQYYGGAKPIPVSIIGTQDQIHFFENFNILGAKNGDNDSVQTYPVCLIYQNGQDALFVNASGFNASSTNKNTGTNFNVRALVINHSQFIGFQSVFGDYGDTQCAVAHMLSSGRSDQIGK